MATISAIRIFGAAALVVTMGVGSFTGPAAATDVAGQSTYPASGTASKLSPPIDAPSPQISTRYLRVLNDTDPSKVDPMCVPDMGVHWPTMQAPEILKLRRTSSMSSIGSGSNPLGTKWDRTVSAQSVIISQLFRNQRPSYPVGQIITGTRSSDGAFVVRVRNFESGAETSDFVDVLPGETKTLYWGSPEDPELRWTVSHSVTRFVKGAGSAALDSLTDVKVAVYEGGSATSRTLCSHGAVS